MLNLKQLKAAQKALRHYQAIYEILVTAGLKEYAEALDEGWRDLVYATTTTLRHNPELGSMVVQKQGEKQRKNANSSAWDKALAGLCDPEINTD